MHAALAAPRGDISKHAPRIITIRVPTEKIRDIIGPGGKMIRSIIERTGVKIDVEDDGRVNIASSDNEASAKAIAIIQELTATPEVDKVYLGRVERITDFGAFIEIMPGCDGLLHVSEMANYRVNDVRDELREGEQVEVKVINIDPSGKVRLSRKVILADGEGTKSRYSPEEKAAHKAAAPPEHTGFGGGRGGDRGGRGGDRGGRGGGRGPRR
jgi:polyribonucleotide nucleotidyltransferase